MVPATALIPQQNASSQYETGFPSGTGLPRPAHGDAPTRRRTASRNTPQARPVRGRPWNADGAHRPPQLCTPTVLTMRTGRPNRAGARPPCVRGQHNMTAYSATR
jgi:hypothetical protein